VFDESFDTCLQEMYVMSTDTLYRLVLRVTARTVLHDVEVCTTAVVVVVTESVSMLAVVVLAAMW
jgi:hypothetical protein